MRCAVGLILCASALAVVPLPVAAQTGSLELVVRVTPSSGRPEPVRGLTIHLLRKSFAEIQKEAEKAEPAPNLDAFVDQLGVSGELKAWMKRNRTVHLFGEDFLRKLKPGDILGVPEFFRAYLARNAGDEIIGFPRPKYTERDRQRNPARYQKQVREYNEAIRKFLEANPHSMHGIDLHLSEIDQGRNWAQQESERQRRIRDQTFASARTRHLVADLETDLDGRAAVGGLAPGEYWLSTLEREAIVGDVRLRWDVRVTVEAGRATRVELANFNGNRP